MQPQRCSQGHDLQGRAKAVAKDLAHRTSANVSTGLKGGKMIH